MPDRRLELDAVLRCPTCRGVPYRVFRRQVSPGSPVFEHVLWPTDPAVLPPTDSARLQCPGCREPLRREAP